MQKLLITLTAISLIASTTSWTISCQTNDRKSEFSKLQNLNTELGPLQYTSASDASIVIKQRFYELNQQLFPIATSANDFNVKLSSVNLINNTAEISTSINSTIFIHNDTVKVTFEHQQDPINLKNNSNIVTDMGKIQTNNLVDAFDLIKRYFIEWNQDTLLNGTTQNNLIIEQLNTSSTNNLLVYGANDQSLIVPGKANGVSISAVANTDQTIKLNTIDGLNLSIGDVQGLSISEIQKHLQEQFYEVNQTRLPVASSNNAFYVPLSSINLINQTAMITGSVKSANGFSVHIEDGVNLKFNVANGNSDHPQDINGYYYLTSLDDDDYYSTTSGAVGEALKQQLTTIINTGLNRNNYGDARYFLAESDAIRDANGEALYVKGVYDNAHLPTSWVTGEQAWQREHVWPSSRLGTKRPNDSTKGIASDLHNLRAIAGTGGSQSGVNQSKSSLYYGGASEDGKWKKIDKNVFYPGDDNKGDVARIIFYMLVMYPNILNWTNDAELLNNFAAYDSSGAYIGFKDDLLRWHKEDPVDAFETARNEYIYSGVAYRPNGHQIEPQHNRNPFIDHPEFAHLIWEGKTIEQLTNN